VRRAQATLSRANQVETPRVPDVPAGAMKAGAGRVSTAEHLAVLQRRAGNRSTVAWLGAVTASKIAAARPAAEISLQRVPSDEELQGLGKEIADLGKEAPTGGGNVWHFSDSKSTDLYVIGTIHAGVFPRMAKRKEIFNFLTTTGFDYVYKEISSNLTVDAKAIKQAFKTLDGPAPEESAESSVKTRDRIYKQRANQTLDISEKLDDIYGALANKNAATLGLETDESRKQIRKSYEQTSDTNRVEIRPEPDEINTMEQAVTSGNEQDVMSIHSGYLKKGVDPQDIEARNEQWANGVEPGGYHVGKKVLWIVGASHLAGLSLALTKKGWEGGPHPL
jgi:hypothetical protein